MNYPGVSDSIIAAKRHCGAALCHTMHIDRLFIVSSSSLQSWARERLQTSGLTPARVVVFLDAVRRSDAPSAARRRQQQEPAAQEQITESRVNG
jgi:hypothetical protein